MEKIKNIALTGTVVGVLVLIGLSTTQPNAPTAKDVAKEISLSLGALVGPDIPYQYLSVGGFRTISLSSGLNTASSTVCAFKPAATSTLSFASLQVLTGTSTTLVWDIGKSTNPTATTTGFLATAGVSLTGGKQGTIVASTSMNGTSDTGLDGRTVFGPNDWLVMKYGGEASQLTAGAAKYNSLAGSCKAEFKVN